mmetsp:Transcript_28691/g.44944  ORF Transcript_28691/g.44944 Transcript_28691/m.44944 type:complete len:122 (-) Transcript_28691:562-927(-)
MVQTAQEVAQQKGRNAGEEFAAVFGRGHGNARSVCAVMDVGILPAAQASVCCTVAATLGDVALISRASQFSWFVCWWAEVANSRQPAAERQGDCGVQSASQMLDRMSLCHSSNHAQIMQCV